MVFWINSFYFSSKKCDPRKCYLSAMWVIWRLYIYSGQISTWLSCISQFKKIFVIYCTLLNFWDYLSIVSNISNFRLCLLNLILPLKLQNSNFCYFQLPCIFSYDVFFAVSIWKVWIFLLATYVQKFSNIFDAIWNHMVPFLFTSHFLNFILYIYLSLKSDGKVKM